MASKILANRLKHVLFEGISNEQFGFLFNQQSLDFIWIAQEGIHSIIVKKLSTMVLKLDMKKAYHRVQWTFLHLVLLQIGLNLNITSWIMGCVVSANFDFSDNSNQT